MNALRQSPGGAMTIRDAEAYTGVSRDTLMRAIHTTGVTELPPLPAKKVGSRYLILRADLDQWLRELPEA